MNRSSLKVNFLYSFIYQILLIALPLITSPYISRVLGSDGIGIYSYTYSVASCFAIFGMLGVSNYGNRTIAANRDNKSEISKLFFNIWAVQIIMTAIVFCVYMFYIFLFAKKIYRTAMLIQAITVLCSFVDISWFFFGLEKFKLTVLRNLVIKIVSTLAIFSIVKDKADLYIYIAIVNLSFILSNLSLFPFLKRYINFVKPSWQQMKPHFIPMIILFVPVLAVTLYKKMDKIMLGNLSTMSQIGFYENAEKIVNIPMGMVTALGTVMMPRMSYMLNKGDIKKSEHYMYFSMEFTFFFASALTFGIAAIAKEFIPLFYGEEYSPASNILIILSTTVFFISLANVLRSQYIIPKHYDRIYIFSVCIAAVINLILNYLFIKSNAAVGAATATVIAEATVLLIQMCFLGKKLPIISYIFNGLYYVFSGLIMFFSVRGISIYCFGWRGIIMEIFLGIFIYFGLCFPYILNKKMKRYTRI